MSKDKIKRGTILAEISKKIAMDESDVKRVIETFFDIVVDHLKKGAVISIYRFGVFEMKYFQPRIKHNPNTRKHEQVPGRYSPKFTFSIGIQRQLKK